MRNYFCLVVFIVFCLSLISPAVNAPPPSPHNVKGRIFNSDGITGVENGIPVRINDTNNSNSVLTYVYAPDVPSLKGAYSASINGSDNDLINVTSWNSTHYGYSTAYLLPTTTEVDVVLEIIRPSETNATITDPANNSLFNISGINNITAQIKNIGGQTGTNCYAVLSISNGSVLDISGDTYSHSLSSINIGSSTTTSWNIAGLDEGNINITVNSYCDSDGINLDNVNYDSVNNITLQDITTPVINLTYPADNSNVSYLQNPVSFTYNVTDESEIINCSLVLNSNLNQTNHTIEKEVSQYFYQALDPGSYNWSIECTDNSSSRIKGFSQTYNFTLLSNNAPFVSNLKIDDPIDLNPGSIKIVYCNFTITENDNISDIKSVNSTLYHSSVNPDSQDDNNSHYTNNSCEITDSSEFIQDYSCSFSMLYYSNPETWSCNITAYDNSSASGSSKIDTNVNELIALDVTPSLIDYGDLQAGNISQEDSNLTITNLGNRGINITLEGYGVTEEDGLAMDCLQNNIPVGYEKYSVNFQENYINMINLTATAQQIGNFTLPQRTDDTFYKEDRNNTYWKINIPYGAKGQCNGSIKLIAIPD